MSGKIFISYRRDDDPGFTGRLFDCLVESFSAEQLFMDVDSIDPGLDFVKVLAEEVAKCDVLLAVIGREWIKVTDDRGRRRLEDPNDFVRIEIESALSQGKRVVPVLVHDAPLPRPEELPDALKSLVRRHAVRLTHERFKADTVGLVRVLEGALREAQAARGAGLAARKRAEPEPAVRHEEVERDAGVQRSEAVRTRTGRGWSIAAGVLLIIGGLEALAAPYLAALSAAPWIARGLVFVGLAELISAFSASENRPWRVSLCLLYGGVGVYILLDPPSGLGALAFTLAWLFLVRGAISIFGSLQLRPLPGWGWWFFDGAITLLLAFPLFPAGHSNSVRRIALLVGISLIVSGASRLAFAFARWRAAAPP